MKKGLKKKIRKGLKNWAANNPLVRAAQGKHTKGFI